MGTSILLKILILLFLTGRLDAQGLLQTLSSTEAAWFKPFAHLYSAVKNQSGMM